MLGAIGRVVTLTDSGYTNFVRWRGAGLPRDPGTWLGTVGGIWVCCPRCERVAQLDHEVDDEGRVTPSVDCPVCSYHESGVVLADW